MVSDNSRYISSSKTKSGWLTRTRPVEDSFLGTPRRALLEFATGGDDACVPGQNIRVGRSCRGEDCVTHLYKPPHLLIYLPHFQGCGTPNELSAMPIRQIYGPEESRGTQADRRIRPSLRRELRPTSPPRGTDSVQPLRAPLGRVQTDLAQTGRAFQTGAWR